MTRLIFGGALAAVIVGLLAVVYLSGVRHGTAAERVIWTERENVRAAAIDKERTDQALKIDRLHVEVETLRARPEKIRTVTKLIRVESDAQCESLPASWRDLWRAGSLPDGSAGDQGQAANGSFVGHAGVP